jgi:hypothetical protein
MTEIMSDARVCDTSCLMSFIIAYLPHDLATSTVPPLLLNDKSKQGWNHTTMAAVLCPLKLHARFLLDPMYALY